MASVNKVILIGNLGKDPENRTFPDGGGVVNFSLATSERWTDKQSGEKREKTEWHSIVVRNEHLRKLVLQYCKKGSALYIEGKLQTRKWQTQSGEDRYTTEIVLDFDGKVQLLGARSEAENAGHSAADRGADAGSAGAGEQELAYETPF